LTHIDKEAAMDLKFWLAKVHHSISTITRISGGNVIFLSISHRGPLGSGLQEEVQPALVLQGYVGYLAKH
jgi:hypothetical protein